MFGVFALIFEIFLRHSRKFIVFSFLSLATIFLVSSSADISAATRNINNYKFGSTYSRHIEDGELEILSFHLSYPNRISKPKRKGSEIGFYLDNTWYYWADGRLLPEDSITNIDEYSPHPFYKYSSDMLALPEKNEMNKLLMQEEYEKRKKQKPRNFDFFDRLYNAQSIKSIEKDITLVRLLGYWVRINSSISPILTEINKEIETLAKTDKEVASFLASLKTVSGYVLKDIAKSKNTCCHSYGVAFDILPKNNKKAVYWSWSRVNNKDWYAISYNDRWSPPKAVIEIFEKHGFVWGGKWTFFDTIHFEYRPEIIKYNNLLLDRENAMKLLSDNL